MPIQQENELKQKLRGVLTEKCTAIRGRRRLVEERMLDSRAKWMNYHSDAHFRASDTDPSHYNVPFGRRTEERTIVRIVKMLTPTPKWHETQPMGGVNVDQARLSNVDAFMGYVLRKRIQSRSNISQLARTCIMYGRPVLKTSIQVINGNIWPSQRVVDPFSFYTYPETSPTINEDTLCFEDFMISYEKYSALAKKGMWDELNESDIATPDWPYHLVERLSYQGITHPMDATKFEDRKRNTRNELETTMLGYLSMTELWLYREDSLYQVYIVWNVKPHARITGFFQSKYEEPLYRQAIHRPLPGETYTNAQAEDVSELDTIQTDLFNQFLSAVDWEQGIVLNGLGSQQRRDRWKMKGRAIWDCQADDIRSAVQFYSPQNTSNNLLKAWQVTVAMIQSLGGSGSIAEGQPGRNMPRAGNAMQSLIGLGMADVTDIAELIEQEILTPGLSDIYKVAQFIPASQMIKIPGGKAFYPGNDNPSMLLYKKDIVPFDAEFEWVGSLQFQDEQQNAQRMMIFLNLLANPQIQQQLAQLGMMVNLGEMLQMMWRYTLGQRGLDKIIIPIPQPPPVSPDAPLTPNGQGTPPGANSKPSSNGSNGVPGLQYRIPSVTAGFVQQQ